MRKMLYSCWAVLAVGVPAIGQSCDPCDLIDPSVEAAIVIPDVEVRPDDPAALIPIYACGCAPVDGVDLYVQIGPEDGASGLTIGVDAISFIAEGRVFEPTTSELVLSSSAASNHVWAVSALADLSGTVRSNGVLATIRVDTTDMLPGSVIPVIASDVLQFTQPPGFTTGFAGTATVIRNGRVTITETPGACPPVAAPAGCCPACDADGSAEIDIADLLVFLDVWLRDDGDYNGDGETSIVDLLEFLDCWLPNRGLTCA